MFVFFAALTALMCLVIYLDATRFTIPNWLNGLIIALYPFYVLMSPVAVNWQHGLIAFAIVLVVGFAIFAMKWMGGGDIKLLVATALWIGFSQLADYIIVVALLGGALSLLVVMLRKLAPYVLKYSQEKPLPRLLRDGEPMAYGLAIALGFLGFLWTGNITGIAF